MMDKDAVKCAEAYVGAGYPLDAEGLLIVELDGPAVEVDYLVERVAEIARGRGATTVRVSNDEQERVLFWAGRKAAFPAVGQITPDYMCLDGSVPRGRLVEVLAEMREMSKTAWPARGQRLPCRRRQPPSADPVRRQRSPTSCAAPRNSAPTSCGSACGSAAC